MSSRKRVKDTPQSAATPAAAVPELNKADQVVPKVNQDFFRKLFFGSLIAMLIVTLFSGYNVGYHTDEMDMNNYCKANLNYYLSGGKDTTYLGRPIQDENKIEPILRFYGSAFEYIPVVFNRVTGLDKGPGEFNSRHVFVQLFGILALLFSGLIAYRINGWRTALITVWLLYLTPAIFGGMLFNSKDIPFCAGYVMTLYFAIRFLEKLPVPDWKTSIAFMLSFAFTTGTRVGGLLVLFSFFLFLGIYLLFTKGMMKAAMDHIKSIGVKLLAIVVGGMALVVITWPFVLTDPANNLVTTMTVVKKFPMIIPLNFEGVFTDSLNIPPHYLIKFMSITIPVVILVLIIGGVVLAFLKRERYNWKLLGFVLFASVFPMVYAVATHVAIYSQWRHFTFVYPGLCLFGAIGVDYALNAVNKPAIQLAIAGALVLGLSHPITWMFKNHPYEYAYFNEVSGGYKKAYYEYETDYWKISMKNGLEWLMKNEKLDATRDSVTLATDMDMFVKYYIKRHYPSSKVRVVLSDVKNRYAAAWDYAVFSKQFQTPEYLEKFFPPGQMIYAERVDNLPETVVLKDLERLDLKARTTFEAHDYQKTDSLLSIYLTKQCPDNVGLFGVMALVKAYVGKNDECLKYGQMTMDSDPTDLSAYNALCGMAIAYSNKQDYNSAKARLNEAIKLMPQSAFARNLLNNLQASGH